MPVQQNKSRSDLEKRLKSLKAQLYGKQTIQPADNLPILQYRLSPASQLPIQSSPSIQSDITYLNQDLKKILFLSLLALGIQFSLYLTLKYNLIKLPLVS